MSLSPATIDAMIASGCSAEQIGAVVKADMADAEARRAAKRENNAERQQRFRERRKSRKNNVRNALPGVTPPIDTLTPGSVSSPDGEPLNGECAEFPRPEWADPLVWADFMGNRKAKKARNTATAHRQFLADIDRLADDEWPPGRLLEHATAKGWKGIYDPRSRPSDKQPPNNDEIQNPYARVAARRQAERAAAVRG